MSFSIGGLGQAQLLSTKNRKIAQCIWDHQNQTTEEHYLALQILILMVGPQFGLHHSVDSLKACGGIMV